MELSSQEFQQDRLFQDLSGFSTLGVLWHPNGDYFTLRVADLADSRAVVTKRLVTSEVARLFDPLGWAAPVLIFGKIFIQKLWSEGLDWDKPLPTNLLDPWHRFCADLPRFEFLAGFLHYLQAR